MDKKNVDGGTVSPTVKSTTKTAEGVRPKRKKPCKRRSKKAKKPCEAQGSKQKHVVIEKKKGQAGDGDGESKGKRSVSVPPSQANKETQKSGGKRRSSGSTAPEEKKKSSGGNDLVSTASKLLARKIKKPVWKVSNLVFVMPKSDDPQAKAQAYSEKKISKLVRYVKKYWSVHVDKKFYPVRIDYRMPDRMTHQRPDNWWLMKRARQKQVEHTGFFSNVREPYHDLGPPEMDTPMLIFKNIHDDLLLDPNKWLQDRNLKDEIINKCNAPLVRLPRARVRRPHFNKGRVKVGAGGMLDINKYVKQGYVFRNGIRGDYTYTQTLDRYMEEKEGDSADLASAFGVVAKKVPESAGADRPTSGKATPRAPKSPKPSMDAHDMHEIHAFDNVRKASNTDDDRLNQRNMLNFERMMSAIYDIIRSMLNIKASQLRSNFPLPLGVVTYLRSSSPQKEKLKPKAALEELADCRSFQAKKGDHHKAAKRSKFQPSEEEEEEEDYEEGEEEDMEMGEDSLRATLDAQVEHALMEAIEDEEEDDEEEEEEEEGSGEKDEEGKEEEEDDEEEELEETRSQMLLRKAKESVRALPIIPQRVHRSIAASVVESIKGAHVEQDGESPEDKCKAMKDNPEQEAARLVKQLELYNRLFNGGEPDKPPIWININLDSIFNSESREKQVQVQDEDDRGPMIGENISTQPSQLPSTTKIPHIGEIHTPILEGLESPFKLDSEEQSRLNLLAKNPEAAINEPPPSPVQLLYKVAGIQTTEQQVYRTLLSLKKKFRVTEKGLKFYYANETDKEDYETLTRFRHKIRALKSCPIYEQSIHLMRQSMKFSLLEERQLGSSAFVGEKRPSLWYRKLRERFEEIGAGRHIGCVVILGKLLKYCDVDMKTKPKMLNRLCLLVVSLPTTELATRPWQMAIKFMLDHFLGLPIELFYQWLDYRRLPSLI